jgi:hypothetical protein
VETATIFESTLWKAHHQGTNAGVFALPLHPSYGQLVALFREFNLHLDAFLVYQASDLVVAPSPSGSSPEASRWPAKLVLG